MAERIEYPPELQGSEEEQIRGLYRYLRRMAEQLNGNQEVTDDNLSTYISAQAQALRAISGATGRTAETTDVRTLTEELVETLQRMLADLQSAARDTVTVQTFANLFVEKARTTPVTPVGESTAFVLADAIRALQDADTDQRAEIGKLLDETGQTISSVWHGFVWSGQVGTDANDQPVYGVAVGKDVVTWSGGTPTYNPNNAIAVFRTDGSQINGSGIATPAQVAQKADLYAGSTHLTDADQLTAPGKWVLDTGTVSNLPTGTVGAEVLLETEADGNGFAVQKVYDNGKLFVRTSGTNAWNNWYTYAGT